METAKNQQLGGRWSIECRRPGFTVLELLVTTSIATVLAGLLLPALMSARESARRMQCTSHLHNLGVAVQQYHDTSHRLPAAWNETADKITGYGWALELLPLLEESRTIRGAQREVPITAAQNDALRSTDLAIVRCPSDIAEPAFELFAGEEHESEEEASHEEESESASTGELLVRLPATNYVGVFGTMEADDGFPAPAGDGPVVVNRTVRFADLERGQSHTLTIGERTAAMAPSTWFGVDFRGEDAACRLVGSAMTAPNCEPCDECEFASRHSGGANFVWADGHVSLIANDVDSLEYRQLARRDAD